MRTAMFNTEFWEDDNIDELSRDEKLFYILAVTNPKRTTSRIFKCTDTVFRKLGNYERDELEALKNKMREKALIFFYDGWVIIGDNGYIKPNRGKTSYKLEAQEISRIPENIIDFYEKLLLNGSITAIERISISNSKSKSNSNNIYNNYDDEEEQENEEAPKPHNAQNEGQSVKGSPTITKRKTEAMGVENGDVAKRMTVTKEPKTANTRFIKPTIEEIAEYCRARGNSVNAEKFYHHYEARGWKVGQQRTQMKDWKSAVITWESNNFGSFGKTTQPLANVLKSGDSKASRINVIKAS